MDFQPGKQKACSSCSVRGLLIVVLMGGLCFIWESAISEENSSRLVERDFGLPDERSTPRWAIISLHHQLVAESARNEEL